MAINLTTSVLRTILQLPERPFEDVFPYDGTPYYALSHIEPCSVIQCSGTVSSAGNLFVNGVDFKVTAGCVDWTIAGGTKPDLNTPFYFDYTHSRLGADAASLSVFNASMMATQDLGFAFPYGGSTTSGVLMNDLATFIAAYAAAREACYTLANTEIDLASKNRRGAVLIDDNKKTSDWMDAAAMWDKEYRRYLTMVRPYGMVRGFRRISMQPELMIFGIVESRVWDCLYQNANAEYGFEFGGVL